MKKSLFTNILIAIFPTLLFFGVYFLFMGLLKNPIKSSINITPTIINIIIPVIIGAIALFVAAYSYVNRNSFLFIYLFVGSLLVNIAYSLSLMNILIPMKLLRMTITPSLTFVVVGLYVACFWMSLISKIRNRK